MKTGARRHASVGNGSEPASSELRVATRHNCELGFKLYNTDGIYFFGLLLPIMACFVWNKLLQLLN